MNISRILPSLLMVTALTATLVGASFAYFSDQGTSTNNTFSTGTLDLKMTDGDETIAVDSVTASFGGTLLPGSCTGNQTLSLQNNGTVAANHAEVAIANAVSDAGSDATPDMDTYLRINSLTYDGNPVVGQITDANLNGFADLADWAASSTALDNLALTDLLTPHALVLDVCLDSTAPNVLQGDSVTSTYTVTLNQDASQ